MQTAEDGYRRRSTKDQARIVVLMPWSEAVAIAARAIPAGHSSRSAAIRLLLGKGPEALTNSPTKSVG